MKSFKIPKNKLTRSFISTTSNTIPIYQQNHNCRFKQKSKMSKNLFFPSQQQNYSTQINLTNISKLDLTNKEITQETEKKQSKRFKKKNLKKNQKK